LLPSGEELPPCGEELPSGDACGVMFMKNDIVHIFRVARIARR